MFSRKKGFDPSLKVLSDEFLANVWGAGSSGGGQSGETRYDWNPIMAGYWGGPDGRPEQGFLERVNNESRNGYTPYEGNRVAGLNPFQTGAGNALWTAGMYGTGLGDAGRQASLDLVQGKYLNEMPESNVQAGQAGGMEDRGIFNPYANMGGLSRTPEAPYASTGPVLVNSQEEGGGGVGGGSAAMNTQQYVPGMHQSQNLTAGQNEFAGDSPYFNKLLEAGQSKITDAYHRGAGANVRRMGALSGAFGGSAHLAAQNDADSALGAQLGNFTAGMQNSQYDRSANLREADIGRRLGADQFNIGQGSQNYENWANRAFAGSGNDVSRGFQGWENMLNRGLQNSQFNVGNKLNADQFNASQNAGNWNQERNRMAGGIGGAMGNDSNYISNLMASMGYGDKTQGQTQRELDDQYQRWTEGQNWGRNQLGWLGQMLGMAQGSTSNVTQSGGYGGINPAAGLLGAASLYGAMR